MVRVVELCLPIRTVDVEIARLDQNNLKSVPMMQGDNVKVKDAECSLHIKKSKLYPYLLPSVWRIDHISQRR